MESLSFALKSKASVSLSDTFKKTWVRLPITVKVLVLLL
ncbi:hypothetical protein J524_2812 [Acinetobacter baumannii 496487]|uniref:Uncharacterized protein n=1 Tax=Acinetobacter baumannii 1499986 TaxID=1310673 RepID=A0A836LZN7_ACIBA|nr:hypothetical protein J518_3812 [Acinetobacter baumannii 1419130]EXC17205.1 hypothetical protein J533_1493 [Acinetobacter baumannii 4749]EXC37744.1 hypothetical protein J552_2782 [Acinetobacter baumannii 951631]EXG11655.1 hypothetical protein J712_1528 [Acinetobacter baumannii 722310]EXG26887.1 hypothetical protein J719_1876 [Acinetobacter baumannii 323408]EXI02617.1 hypothetical protein J639_2504 [Acinetobacter baumannii 457946]EXI03426.1 hypothetical protein J618_0218 [Acinetobacter bauma